MNTKLPSFIFALSLCYLSMFVIFWKECIRIQRYWKNGFKIKQSFIISVFSLIKWHVKEFRVLMNFSDSQSDKKPEVFSFLIAFYKMLFNHLATRNRVFRHTFGHTTLLGHLAVVERIQYIVLHQSIKLGVWGMFWMNWNDQLNQSKLLNDENLILNRYLIWFYLKSSPKNLQFLGILNNVNTAAAPQSIDPLTNSQLVFLNTVTNVGQPGWHF